MNTLIMVAGTAEVNADYIADALADLAGDTTTSVTLVVFPRQGHKQLATFRAVQQWASATGHPVHILASTAAAGAKLAGQDDTVAVTEDATETTLEIATKALDDGRSVHLLAAFDDEHKPTGDWIYTLLDADFAVRDLCNGMDDFVLTDDPAGADEEGVTDRYVTPAADAQAAAPTDSPRAEHAAAPAFDPAVLTDIRELLEKILAAVSAKREPASEPVPVPRKAPDKARGLADEEIPF